MARSIEAMDDLNTSIHHWLAAWGWAGDNDEDAAELIDDATHQAFNILKPLIDLREL